MWNNLLDDLITSGGTNYESAAVGLISASAGRIKEEKKDEYMQGLVLSGDDSEPTLVLSENYSEPGLVLSETDSEPELVIMLGSSWKVEYE